MLTPSVIGVTRRLLESLYDGKATISEYQKVTNPDTKKTALEEVVVIADQACRLSFETIKPTEQTASSDNVTQIAKLFIAPELTVPAGCKITITQYGRTTAYKGSGQPAVYPTHQEIPLSLWEDYA